MVKARPSVMRRSEAPVERETRAGGAETAVRRSSAVTETVAGRAIRDTLRACNELQTSCTHTNSHKSLQLLVSK